MKSGQRGRALRQHYVPQFYLRKWADNSSLVIHVLDKTVPRTFRANTQDVGAERFFYSQLPEAQTIEKWFAQVEGKIAALFRRILRSESLSSLTDSDRADLWLFVAIMLTRTREMRENVREIAEGLGNEIAKRMGVTDWVFRLTEDGALGYHVAIFNDIPKLAAIVSSLKLTLYLNETGMPFTTSDHPVTRHNDFLKETGRGGRVGLASPGIQLHLPLSPRVSLLMYDPVAYGVLPIRSRITDEENVVFERCLQLQESFRHVFSRPDDSFAKEKEILRKEPTLKELHRKRFTFE